MKALRSFGTKRANPPLQGDPSVARATGLQGWQYGRSTTPMSLAARTGRDPVAMARDSYEVVTWVFRAVEQIAYNQAALKAIVRRGDPDDGNEVNHPLLPLLNWQSSPFMREQAFIFRVRLSATLMLSTKGVFVEVVRNKFDEPIALHLLPPMFTNPIPDPQTFVSGYVVQVGAQRWTVDARNVVWIRRPHPYDPYRSMTPAEAAGLAIDTDLLAHIYNKRFMENDGRPGGIIGVKGSVQDDDADELKSYVSGGVHRAGEWRVVDGIEGLDVADMATTPRDAQYVEQRGLTKTEILVAYGVPESLVGNASQRTFDNAGTERRMFWSETMPPHLRLIANGFDLVDDDPNTFLAFDLSRVDVLAEAEADRRKGLRDEVGAGVRTPNQYLEAVGEKPFEAPEADLAYIPISLTPMWSLAEQTGASPNGSAPPLPPAPSSEQGVPSGGTANPVPDGGAKSGSGARPKGSRTPARTARHAGLPPPHT